MTRQLHLYTFNRYVQVANVAAHDPVFVVLERAIYHSDIGNQRNYAFMWWSSDLNAGWNERLWLKKFPRQTCIVARDLIMMQFGRFLASVWPDAATVNAKYNTSFRIKDGFLKSNKFLRSLCFRSNTILSSAWEAVDGTRFRLTECGNLLKFVCSIIKGCCCSKLVGCVKDFKHIFFWHAESLLTSPIPSWVLPY